MAELLAYFRLLQRQLDSSVLLVHHTRKNAAGEAAAGQGLRGSGDIHAFGDSNLYLRRTREHLLLSSEHRAPGIGAGLSGIGRDQCGADPPGGDCGASGRFDSSRTASDVVSKSKCSTICPGRGGHASEASRLAGCQRAPGRALESLERAGRLCRTPAGWQRRTDRSSGSFPFPIESKGTERSKELRAWRSAGQEHTCQASTSKELALRSRSVHREAAAPFPKVVIPSPSRLRPRIALTRPGDARAKAGGAIPLVEPELSPESLLIACRPRKDGH